MQQDFGVSVDSSVKLVIRLNGFLETDFVAHDKTRLGSSSYDQIAEVTIVGLDVALSGTKEQSLVGKVSSSSALNNIDLPSRTTCQRRSRFDPLQIVNLAHLGPGQQSAYWTVTRVETRYLLMGRKDLEYQVLQLRE